MSPPEPMTPPECDLRGYEYMPLFGQRLFGSAFYSLALQNPRAGLAGQKLWWEAWQQCPAGSLPADDLTLCRMADFGSDLKAWAKAKEVALHGFVLCSDGRLYHHLLCKEAIVAYAKRVRDRNRKAKWRATQTEDGGGGHADVPRDATRTEHANGQGRDGGRDGDVRADRTGQERKEERAPPLAPPVPGGAKNRGRVSLPSDWLPNESQRRLASELGLDPDATALNFRDHCLAQAKRLGDPDAAWRVWCRVAASAHPSGKHRSNNGLLELHRRVEAGEDVVGGLLAEMEAERAKAH